MSLVGIAATADDVVVTVGSQQALDLVSRVLLDPGDVVLAESPSYVGALGSFASAEAVVRHVAMDSDGLIPEALWEELEACRAAGQRVKFLYTIPNYQNPAGVSLSEQRREQVLEIAAEYDLLIVEDDPYALLGFESEPARALRARDAERVIYLGSFSKTFAPGMRVGWAVAPHGVREKLVLASEAQILCPPTFNQLAVSTYLSTQPWKEQVKVFRELYRERRDAMIAALTPRRCRPGSRGRTRTVGSSCGSSCRTVSTRKPCKPAR
jgi:DNA-binding transcriptional MocR family regulator